MPFWEYKTLSLTLEVQIRRSRASTTGEHPARDSIESMLNEHGEQGWELVTVLAQPADGQMTFTGVMKRELMGEKDRRRRGL